MIKRKDSDNCMDTDKIKKIEQWRNLAEVYLQKDIRVFIKDFRVTWYFADILIVGENILTIQCFAPEDKNGKKFYLMWEEITFFDRYKEEKV